MKFRTWRRPGTLRPGDELLEPGADTRGVANGATITGFAATATGVELLEPGADARGVANDATLTFFAPAASGVELLEPNAVVR
jgi:hypothetical protein